MADQETESHDSGNVPHVVPPDTLEPPSGYPGPPPAYPGPPLPGYQSTTVQIVYIPYPVPRGEPSESSRSSHLPQHFNAPPCPIKGTQYSETASMLPPDVQEFVSRYGSQYLTDEPRNSQTFVLAGPDLAQSQSQVQTQNETYPRVITSQQHDRTTTSAEQQQVDGEEPRTHFWLAVLVCCCCCPLIRAIAVGFSVSSHLDHKNRNYDEATRKARISYKISVCGCFVMMILVFLGLILFSSI